MRYQLSIIQYPSGKFGFVGSVPYILAFESSDQSFIESQLRLPAKYRALKNRVFNSEIEAQHVAELLGYTTNKTKGS